ncbi:response regulator transcription factor [Pseudoalteromonas luteoviolacea]|uniref:response regulator transcription factor n=1 Tax=Pseudoalteromonas luteoviolacea TaxID=43657 RepID=UPI001B386271|nr:response regulator transcription factor [Pseudoalteromonas luteoviolacea]MBQ4812443.1 response regulator transcription factor [Pseudoalteromonas luteoviolacea]
MTKSILIVEDDTEMADLTSMLLESEGYQCAICSDGDKAIDAVKNHNPNLVLLDLMLPGKSGLEICKELRAFYTGAILVLTGKDNDISEVALLKAGADDYVLKPMKPHVLIARIESILRRMSQTSPSPTDHFSVSGLNIYPNKRTVKLDTGELLNLTTAEFDILLLLAQNAGSAVSRDECSKASRGIESDAYDRAIDMRISGLRKKLSNTSLGDSIIVTVRNKGYMLSKT